MVKRICIVVDILAFLLFLVMTSTGLLLHFMLPPRSGRFASILGMNRHDWGEFHFWVAVGLFSTLMVHLVLHARFIKFLFRGGAAQPDRIRLVLGLIGLVVVLILLIMPFFLKTTV